VSCFVCTPKGTTEAPVFTVLDPVTGKIADTYWTEEVAHNTRSRWQQHPEWHARNGWTVAEIQRLEVRRTP